MFTNVPPDLGVPRNVFSRNGSKFRRRSNQDTPDIIMFLAGDLPLDVVETIVSFLLLDDLVNIVELAQHNQPLSFLADIIQLKAHNLKLYNHSNYNVILDDGSRIKLSESKHILDTLCHFHVDFFVTAYDFVQYDKIIEKYHDKFVTVQFVADDWFSFRQVRFPHKYISSKTTGVSIEVELMFQLTCSSVLNMFPNLSKLNLSFPDVEIVLPYLPNLKTASFEGHGSTVFNLPSSVEKLSLSNCDIDTNSCTLPSLSLLTVSEVPNILFVIDIMLASKASLKSLQWIQRHLFEFLTDLLKHLVDFPKLKDLCLNAVDLTDQLPLNVSYLSLRSCSNWDISMPFLTELRLNSIHLYDSTDILFNCPLLTTLMIREVTLNTNQCILNFPKQLTQLELGTLIPEDGSPVFESKRLRLPENLKLLVITRWMLDLVPVLSTDIEVLDLSSNNISETHDFRDFSKLVKLNLKGNQLTNVSVLAPNLKELDVSNNSNTNLIVNENISKLCANIPFFNGQLPNILRSFPKNLTEVDLSLLGATNVDAISFLPNVSILSLKGLKNINSICFGDQSKLKRVTIDFLELTGSIVFPKSLKYLKFYLFGDCEDNATLENVQIPDTISEMIMYHSRYTRRQDNIIFPNRASPQSFFANFTRLSSLQLVGLNLLLTSTDPLQVPLSIESLELSRGISDEIHLQFPEGESQLKELILIQQSSNDEHCPKYTFESIGYGKNGCMLNNLEYIISNTTPFLPHDPETSERIYSRYSQDLREFEEFEVRVSQEEIQQIYKTGTHPPNLILIEIEDGSCEDREPILNPKFSFLLNS